MYSLIEKRLNNPEMSQHYIDRLNKTGDTPLHLSVWYKKFDDIEYFLKLGYNINSKNFNGQTPLDMAINSKQPDFAKLLIEKGANIDNALINAADNGVYEIIPILLEKNSLLLEKPNSDNNYNYTPLITAANSPYSNGNTVKVLLDHGASIDARCSSNMTILEHATGSLASATCYNYIDRIAELIKYGEKIPGYCQKEIENITHINDFFKKSNINNVDDFNKRYENGQISLFGQQYVDMGLCKKPFTDDRVKFLLDFFSKFV